MYEIFFIKELYGIAVFLAIGDPLQCCTQTNVPQGSESDSDRRKKK